MVVGMEWVVMWAFIMNAGADELCIATLAYGGVSVPLVEGAKWSYCNLDEDWRC